LVEPLDEAERLLTLPRDADAADGLHLRQLADVRTGDERLLARAGHHDPAHFAVLREGPECPVDLRHGLGVQGVELVRTVDGEGRDALAPLDRDEAVRIRLCHDGSPSIRDWGSRGFPGRERYGTGGGGQWRRPRQAGATEPRTAPSTIRSGSKQRRARSRMDSAVTALIAASNSRSSARPRPSRRASARSPSCAALVWPRICHAPTV